ncbi:MAG TPA: C4-dicarboxylate ABC transporter permease [Syntrophomonas sp.]|jgi:tripartite ATP-independent transporter DctM subunit|nr:C4-dicarboxylate ABC transporter permease [Syntrophomonas sp.]
MGTAVIGLILVVTLILLGIPIALSLFVVGFGGIWYLTSFHTASSAIHYTPLGSLVGSDLASLPLFMMIGAFALTSGVASAGYKTARTWLGRLPGGLGVATIAASAAFCCCSGSSVASAMTMGKLSIKEMQENKYDDGLAAGVCGAGGLLATMIPPSGAMVLYGLVSGESISQLLVAGFVPALIILAGFIGIIVGTALLFPDKAPLVRQKFSWREKFRSLPNALGIIAIFATIFIGLFTGAFTPTQAAAWGALIALVLLILKGRAGLWDRFKTACIESAEVNVSILFLMLGAYVFSNFLVIAGLPQAIQATVTGLNVAPILIIIAILLSYVFLGMFLESVTMMLITIPIYYPIVVGLGFSGIWFGVVVMAMVEIGMLTPPFGIVAFAIKSVAPDIDVMRIFKGVIPFALAELAVVFLLLAFPQICLWLPSLMK